MKITVLAASGRTGLELVRQALRRGHTVTAIARDPQRIAVPDSARLHKVAGDVDEPGSIAAAIDAGAVVLSALGTERAGVLTAGARAVLAAGPGRVIWLGAYGTGRSAKAAGPAAEKFGALLGDRLADKVMADGAVLAAGGTVVHAGLLGDDPESPSRRTVGLTDAPPLDLAEKISRATVAAVMLDEAETPRFEGTVAVALSA
ncbi:NAD(P)-dependent oxidoreductase [Actinoplanes sp. NPDC049265]|uniref:NAD(P)-dependent oxidoreductase n=1 Tax=Actinoplanes sp. NPDC049265 TaxID=3363902 RepID=UPI003716D009